MIPCRVTRNDVALVGENTHGITTRFFELAKVDPRGGMGFAVRAGAGLRVVSFPILDTQGCAIAALIAPPRVLSLALRRSSRPPNAR